MLINKKELAVSTKPSTTDYVKEKSVELELKDLKVGYVMPIAKTEGYPDTHWNDVMSIIDDTVTGLGIGKGRIVSDGGEITTIHSRIVNNLNDDGLIICDVSSRNPNVMFELGMRIAFDKPVIIIKDDVTDYCFDSGIIEHINYPKDLRHRVINKFKSKLSEKIIATFDAFIKTTDLNVSPILKNFGSFDKRDVKLNELSANEILIKDIQTIKNSLVRLQMANSPEIKDKPLVMNVSPKYIVSFNEGNAAINLRAFSQSEKQLISRWIESKGFEYMFNNDGLRMDVSLGANFNQDKLVNFLIGLRG